MKIKLLDKMTQLGLELLMANDIQITADINGSDVIYTHFTVPETTRYKVILCPCTGIGHLTDIHNVNSIIYLDDKKYLYDKVWSTAEHTVSLILQVLKKLKRELGGSTIGYVGYGRVAMQVSQLLLGFGLTKYVYDKGSSREELEKLFEMSDIITIHLVENEETKDLIGLDLFDYCKKKPIIINTARASILCPDALLIALDANVIAGFGLDVTEGYSELMMGYLRSRSEGVITQHIGGSCLPSREATDAYVINKLLKRKEWLNGKVNT